MMNCAYCARAACITSASNAQYHRWTEMNTTAAKAQSECRAAADRNAAALLHHFRAAPIAPGETFQNLSTVAMRYLPLPAKHLQLHKRMAPTPERGEGRGKEGKGSDTAHRRTAATPVWGMKEEGAEHRPGIRFGKHQSQTGKEVSAQPIPQTQPLSAREGYRLLAQFNDRQRIGCAAHRVCYENGVMRCGVPCEQQRYHWIISDKHHWRWRIISSC